jgi:ubiquinone/menaquinone biosynthesis C-methylase UbiE
MAANDISIIAIDQSSVFLKRAKKRTSEGDAAISDRIDYRLTNATDGDAMLALGEQRFDAAVATLAIMDMSSITPLFQTLTKLLKPGGRFVWSVTHPAFNAFDSRLYAEERYEDGNYVIEHGIRISKYVVPQPRKSIGLVGPAAFAGLL